MKTEIERYYENEELNNWALKNGGRVFGEETMLEMLEEAKSWDLKNWKVTFSNFIKEAL